MMSAAQPPALLAPRAAFQHVADISQFADRSVTNAYEQD
jgi:hypothetical protein